MKQNKRSKKTSINSKPILIECSDLVKKYRNNSVILEVLKKIDLIIREGEFVAISGPSGSGKTTLLHCLAGIDTFDTGDIYFDEENIEKMSEGEKSKMRLQNMGFVFGEVNLAPTINILENIELPGLALKNKSKEIRERAEGLLKEFELEDLTNKMPEELTLFEQQKVSIIRALVNEPKVIWADEPTKSLDTAQSEEIVSLLQKINKEKGIAVVIFTHNSNIAVKANKTVRIDSGKII